MKAPIYGGDFSLRLIEQLISYHKQNGGLPRMIQNVKIQLTNIRRHEFLCGNSEWEKPWGGERKDSLYFSLYYKTVFSLQVFAFFSFVGSLGL